MDRGDVVNYLLLNDRVTKNNRPYWDCTCLLCNKNKIIREDSIKSGRTISDGCYTKSEIFKQKGKDLHPIEDLTGQTFGELTVLKLADRRNKKQILWTCICTCGKTVDVWSANLKNGNSKTCGDFEAHGREKLEKVWAKNLNDITGNIYNGWKVIERFGNDTPTRWLCECIYCGLRKDYLGSCLLNESIGKCECQIEDLYKPGDRVGKWTIIRKGSRVRPNGHNLTTYLCVCECGVERWVDRSRLSNGTSQSCGCVKSAANEYINAVFTNKNINFIPEYKFDDLIGPGGGLLRFDFCILDDQDNIICLIEYQGAQHFRNDIDFGKQQREITDGMKKEYCKTHNLKLFEITYTDNIDEKLEEIFTQIAC